MNLNTKNCKIFCHFYTEMLCAGWGSHHCRANCNVAEKICNILQFLCHFVNSAHYGQFCTKFCVCRIAEFWHPYL